MRWEQHKQLSLKALWGKPGLVDLYIARSDLHTYVILAERYDNPAASVTNAYEVYAAQVCDNYTINPNRTVFFELYVQPKLINKQVIPDYELDVCTPRLPDMETKPTKWRPTQPLMKEEILKSLLRDCEVTYSYEVPEKYLRLNNSGYGAQ